MRAPRYTYFALLIPEIRENLVELALDDQQLAETEEKDWWLEEETTDEADSFLPQGPIRWFVIVLVYSQADTWQALAYRPRTHPIDDCQTAQSALHVHIPTGAQADSPPVRPAKRQAPHAQLDRRVQDAVYKSAERGGFRPMAEHEQGDQSAESGSRRRMGGSSLG